MAEPLLIPDEIYLKKRDDWTFKASEYFPSSEINDFQADEVFMHLPFGVAQGVIRTNLNAYIGSVQKERLTRGLFNPKKWFVSTVSNEMEQAISNSKAILTLELDPDAGVTVQYDADTWQRATKLLREMAELYWQATGDYLSAPSIAPALEGSIDLFWEMGDLTLLINVRQDLTSGVTFFGRRFKTSKISGSLSVDDTQPKHLTAWLSGHE